MCFSFASVSCSRSKSAFNKRICLAHLLLWLLFCCLSETTLCSSSTCSSSIRTLYSTEKCVRFCSVAVLLVPTQVLKEAAKHAPSLLCPRPPSACSVGLFGDVAKYPVYTFVRTRVSDEKRRRRISSCVDRELAEAAATLWSWGQSRSSSCLV